MFILVVSCCCITMTSHDTGNRQHWQPRGVIRSLPVHLVSSYRQMYAVPHQPNHWGLSVFQDNRTCLLINLVFFCPRYSCEMGMFLELRVATCRCFLDITGDEWRLIRSSIWVAHLSANRLRLNHNYVKHCCHNLSASKSDDRDFVNRQLFIKDVYYALLCLVHCQSNRHK